MPSQISLGNLMKLAFALGRIDDFDAVLEPPPAASMAELEASVRRPRRQRGRV